MFIINTSSRMWQRDPLHPLLQLQVFGRIHLPFWQDGEQIAVVKIQHNIIAIAVVWFFTLKYTSWKIVNECSTEKQLGEQNSC